MINPKSEEVWPIKPVDEDILNDRFENSKCVLVSGTKQVGESTLLKHLYSNINYVTEDVVVLPLEYI